jgi:predicted acylesterase/phospholipase RssA
VCEPARALFRTREINLAVVLASACLPLLPTAEIDGESYWDGGAANPTLSCCTVHGDVVAVLLHPRSWPASIQRGRHSTDSQDQLRRRLLQRAAGVSWRAGWLKSCVGVARASAPVPSAYCRRPDLMGSLDSLSKLNARAPFIAALRDAGRERADWLLERISCWPPRDIRCNQPARLAGVPNSLAPKLWLVAQRPT